MDIDSDAPLDENYVGDVRHTVTMGQPRIISSRHATFEICEVIFEDNKRNAYFYARDLREGENSIQDATFVYQVVKPLVVQLEIMWAVGLPRAMLICDHKPQVVYAFDIKKCWSRSNFPLMKWGDKCWSDDAWEGFEDIKA